MLSYLYVCWSCLREQMMPSPNTLPEGWMHEDRGEGILPGVLCPDCVEPSLAFSVDDVSDGDRARLMSAIENQKHLPNFFMPADAASSFTLVPQPVPAFHVHLERQSDGNYHLAAQPAAALMRNAPFTFYLTPAEARAHAAELNRYADLAENPGTLDAGQ